MSRSGVIVAGIDSSTQSCKVVVRELGTGRIVRTGRAPHPDGTIIDPEHWWRALLAAVADAGGLEDVLALSVSGQQHTPVFLDSAGAVVRSSPLWNDTGSHRHVAQLNDELGRDEWIRRTGLPLTLSDTVVKARWLREADPAAARRTAGIALVHDWLTWRLTGGGDAAGGLDRLTTDRSEASGTGYWSPTTDDYCVDLLEHALGARVALPVVLGPLDRAGTTGAGIPGIPRGLPVGVGSGDNAAAALALGLADGDGVLSIGTSGVVYTRSVDPVHDYDGYVCNYADATGAHLPLVATLNAARSLDSGAALLGCSHAEFAELALAAPPTAEGLTVVPYFDGERTPDLPNARGAVLGASRANLTRTNFARAVVEGTVAGQLVMLDALRACGIEPVSLALIGGAARNRALQRVLLEMVDLPVVVPEPDEYVARGAAMQAASTLIGAFPAWEVERTELRADGRYPEIGAQFAHATASLGY